MKEVLPRMHKRANDFQINAIEPMITLGGRIGNFAKDSGRFMDRLVKNLEVMGQPGMVKGVAQFDAAKYDAEKTLDRLTDHAKKVEVECKEMFDKLTAVSGIKECPWKAEAPNGDCEYKYGLMHEFSSKSPRKPKILKILPKYLDASRRSYLMMRLRKARSRSCSTMQSASLTKQRTCLMMRCERLESKARQSGTVSIH